MHDSPQYAYLQTLERLHNECIQKLQGLEPYLSSGAISAKTKDRINAIIYRTRRLFSNAEVETISDRCPIRSFDRNTQRSIESSWQWVPDELEKLATALADGKVSPAVCDRLLKLLESHADAKTRN